jgi:hypothetical protein
LEVWDFPSIISCPHNNVIIGILSLTAMLLLLLLLSESSDEQFFRSIEESFLRHDLGQYFDIKCFDFKQHSIM